MEIENRLIAEFHELALFVAVIGQSSFKDLDSYKEEDTEYLGGKKVKKVGMNYFKLAIHSWQNTKVNALVLKTIIALVISDLSSQF